MELKEKLKALRKKAGLSQLELAEKVFVSRQAVSRWEAGVAAPSGDNIKRLSELYNVSIDWLVDENVELSEGQMPIISAPESVKNVTKTTSTFRPWLLCLLTIIVAMAVIVAVVVHGTSEKKNFNTTGSEDWNDALVEDIPIIWESERG